MTEEDENVVETITNETEEETEPNHDDDALQQAVDKTEEPTAAADLKDDPEASTETPTSTYNDVSLFEELQSNLQQQILLKAEAENRARLAENKLKTLQEALTKQETAETETENNSALAWQRVEEFEQDIVPNLQQQVETLETKTNQAENTAQQALDRVQALQMQREEQDAMISNLQTQLQQSQQETAAQKQEVHKLREEVAEQHRKEMALTSRLNAAKMKESNKANLAEQYQHDMDQTTQDLQQAISKCNEYKAEKQRLEQESASQVQSLKDRLAAAEHSLAEERRLNEERKKKMKAFVATKAEELQQAKTDNDALQGEVSQTNRSLMELNNRWKQLHAQYVQSQTRNRELLRDFQKMKKDSENLHKQGDTLEMKLSQSATETAEHKNKRLAAKHELMTVLRALEAEREKTTQLRDAIKFTFTPKALSQQQLLQESLEDFEAQLQKLSTRLGRPLPPPPEEPSQSEFTEQSEGEEDGSSSRPSDADIHRLLQKLERETQAVSQCIMTLSGNVERMHLVLDASGDRSCVSVLADLLVGSSSAAVESSSESGRPRLGSSSRHRYGTVPSAAMH